LPEPVSFAAYFEHLEQLKRVEHSVCALGDGLFGCYALPLGVYLPPDPSPSLQGVWGTSIPCAFRDDFGWRAREVSWRDFAGGDYCSDDSPELFADPPLCALEEPDGAWVCGAFNAFMRGEPLEPVLDAEGHAVRGGVKLDYETISAFYDGPNGSFYMLREDGTLWSFGNNVFGQLGDGSTQSRDWAAPVELPAKVLRFEPSASGGCALLEDLRVFCWGSVSGLTGEVTPPEAWPPQPSLVPLEIDLEALAASAEPGKGLEAAKP
ncbi:MAG: hypothetical protein RBU37_28150, partial [Myxococcota bacterium]|nr:hypothetical protein [Myxococcota bacterium]